MKREVLYYQSKVCIILGIVLICALCMPRYAITLKLGDALAQSAMEYAGTQDGMLHSAISGSVQSYRKEVQELISGLEEKGIPTKYNSFAVAFSSPKSTLENLVTDYDELSAYLSYWTIVRIYAWLLIAATVGLFWTAVTEQRKKEYVSKTILFAWGLVILNALYVLVVRFIVAGKLNSVSGNGTAMSVKFARRMLWSLHGSGFTVSIIATVFLFFWLLWRYMSMGKLIGLKNVLARVIDVNKYIGGAEGQNMQLSLGGLSGLANRETPPSSSIAVQCIYAVNGTFRGASIPCGVNEQISIGREANLCQIVIANAEIAPKHASIFYDQQRNMYLVTCYSDRGIQVSGYGNLMAQESVQVQPGTHLIIAGTEEFELR